MAAFDATRVNGAGQSFGGRMTKTVYTLLGKAHAWNEARVTRAALSKLSERELDDIGLCRADIADM